MTSATDKLLQTLHQRFPGATPKSLQWARTADGQESYDLLLNALIITSQTPQQILDLGCGDGFLLQRLAARCHPRSQLWGIDLSLTELQHAQLRLSSGGLSNINLVQARAQQLPLLTASVDAICCHFALMLMAPIEPVVAEIGRVLKPGGQFVALTVNFQPNSVLQLFNQVFTGLQPQIPPAFAVLQQVGAQTTNPATLQALFDPKNGFVEPVKLTHFSLYFPAVVSEITNFFKHTYPFAILTPAQQAEFLQTFPVALTTLYATTPDPLILNLHLLTATVKSTINS
jgi:ubiquinone/menaquinone biosynthesis C-methylase UbiE